MAAAAWLKNLKTSVVTTFKADADLPGLCGKIEVGIVDALRSKDIFGPEMPYIGVSAPSFPADSEVDAETGFSAHRVEIRCEVAAVSSNQLTAENVVSDILATLALVVLRQKSDGRFSVSAADGNVYDVFVGGGGITDSLVSKDDASFVVIGMYTFQILFILRLQ